MCFKIELFTEQTLNIMGSCYSIPIEGQSHRLNDLGELSKCHGFNWLNHAREVFTNNFKSRML